MKQGKAAVAMLLVGVLLCQRGDAWNVDPVRDYAGSSYSTSLSIADLDSDGRQDVLLVSDVLSSGAFAGKLVWYRQQADGELAPPVDIVGGSPVDHVAADLNHDGRTDLVVAYRFSLSILMAQADGSFLRSDHERPLDSGWQNSGLNNLVLYDVDADGQRDIVMFAWYGYAAAYLLRTDGTVRSSHGFPLPTQGYNDFAVGDVDHDGIDDLVVSCGQGTGHHLMVLGPDGAGGLAVRADWSTSGNGISSVAVGDTDNDGLQEIVFAWGGNAPNAWMDRILLDTSLNIALYSGADVKDVPTSVVAADLNADGTDDVAMTHNGWYSIGTMIQSKGELLPEQLNRAMTNTWQPDVLAVGDLDSDGCPDMAVANGGDTMMLQVLRGRECAISPLPTVDYGVTLRTHYSQAYSEFPDIRSRVVTATLRTYRSGEVLIRDPVMHMRITAVPPYTVDLASTQSEWGLCTIEGNHSASAMVVCAPNAAANEFTSPSMAFAAILDPGVPTRVRIEAWATSGGVERGEVYDKDMKNQRATLYADFDTLDWRLRPPAKKQ
jgi:hypothetical protein